METGYIYLNIKQSRPDVGVWSVKLSWYWAMQPFTIRCMNARSKMYVTRPTTNFFMVNFRKKFPIFCGTWSVACIVYDTVIQELIMSPCPAPSCNKDTIVFWPHSMCSHIFGLAQVVPEAPIDWRTVFKIFLLQRVLGAHKHKAGSATKWG